MKRSPLFVIFITVFIDLVSFGIVIPLLPFYAQQFGASGITVGLLLSVFSMMTFLFMPVWGKLSDHHGRRPIILITVVGSVIAYILFSTATSLWMLFLSRTLAGIANSNLSVAQAYIADVTKPEERAKGMGLIGSAFGLGFVFGPLISGIFSAEYFGSLKYTL
ncbi:MFS transporter, partial [bacterium]|nr:MFS transporter [bacterium]